jgi:hypothetical protein
VAKRFAVGRVGVGIGHGAIFNVLAGSAANFFDIRYKWPAIVGLRRLWTHNFLFSTL